MKKTFAQFGITFSKNHKNYIRIFLFLVLLAMLVLGAGAPDGSGPF